MSSERNIGLEISTVLRETFGFVEGRFPGEFVKEIDPQHAVIVDVEPWDEKPPGGSRSPGVRFGVARRDINELWAELLDNSSIVPLTPLIEGAERFCGQPRASWLSHRDPPEEIEAWLLEWVPRLLDEVPNLTFIQAYLKRNIDPAVVGEVAAQNYGRTTAPVRMMDRLLDGVWTPQDHDELLVPLWGGSGAMWEAAAAAIADWHERHPNGVDRDLR